MRPTINHETTPEYFMIDYPRDTRITHYPSGDTCFKHMWMRSGEGQSQWEEKLIAFLAKYPHVNVVVNGAYEIIDDANDFPHRGGMLKVGDTVMVWHRDYDYCADRIVRELPYTGTPDHPNHPAKLFELESGNRMYWGGQDDAWHIWDVNHSGTIFNPRVRRPLEGEPTPTLDEKMAERAAFRM
jgi:hypothetical protein